MESNVFITVRRDGKIVERREGHNTWVDFGRNYLARMAVDPPIEQSKIKYMGFGVGSVHQATAATTPPISTAYPPGSDPNATAGNEYSAAYPIFPPIQTLELPIRISGGTTPYPGSPGDVWLVQPPNIASFIENNTTLVVKAIIDTNAGDITYGPFTSMPLTEAGLFLATASPTADPYTLGHMVAYHSFVTLFLLLGSYVEILWKVKF